MNDETAKKLKEAGFPIQQTCGHCGEGYAADVEPTLEEIIEACGDDFESLIKQAGGWVAISSKERYMLKQNWKAVSSPETAVANLYLALHPSE